MVFKFCDNLTPGRQKGATLLELLLVIAIIAILTLIVFPSYETGDNQMALQRSANKLAQDIRRAEEMAVSAQEYLGAVPAGYGVYLDTNEEESYILYVDRSPSINQKYDGGDEQIEQLNLEKGVYISLVSSDNGHISINFKPPDPQINLDVNPAADSITITLSLRSDPSKTELVIVNKTGLIYVQ